MRWYAPDQADMKQPEADPSCLSSMAQQIACALNLRVFGFDAILDVDGNLNVIDVNDWPSFSKFRDEAASEIAKL
jgi:glutathione synthase/RimK-type ligase-like ATP-grasp enzyme